MVREVHQKYKRFEVSLYVCVLERVMLDIHKDLNLGFKGEYVCVCV